MQKTSKTLLTALSQHKISAGNPEAVAKGLFSVLTIRQEKIINRRFSGPEKVWLEDIGKELGISRDRVRILEFEALKNILRLVKYYNADDLVELGKRNLRRMDVTAKSDYAKNGLLKKVVYRLKLDGGSYPIEIIENLETVVANHVAELQSQLPNGMSGNDVNPADLIAARIRKEHQVSLVPVSVSKK